MVCSRCQETGHRASDCKLIKCNLCLMMGHAYKDCPNAWRNIDPAVKEGMLDPMTEEVVGVKSAEGVRAVEGEGRSGSKGKSVAETFKAGIRKVVADVWKDEGIFSAKAVEIVSEEGVEGGAKMVVKGRKRGEPMKGKVGEVLREVRVEVGGDGKEQERVGARVEEVSEAVGVEDVEEEVEILDEGGKKGKLVNGKVGKVARVEGVGKEQVRGDLGGGGVGEGELGGSKVEKTVGKQQEEEGVEMEVVLEEGDTGEKEGPWVQVGRGRGVEKFSVGLEVQKGSGVSKELVEESGVKKGGEKTGERRKVKGKAVLLVNKLRQEGRIKKKNPQGRSEKFLANRFSKLQDISSEESIEGV